MEGPYRLVVGLGNPGPAYRGTRHNVGFDVLDALASADSFREEKRGPGAVARWGGATCLKPLTYMNLSGQAVRAWMDWQKLTPADVLIITDEAALPLGEVRLRRRGSPGGHNGLKSIQAHLGTQDYARLRCGVGPIPPLWRLEDFVLGKFGEGEEEGWKRLITLAADALRCCQDSGIEVAMNAFNKRASGPTTPAPDQEGPNTPA